MQESPVSDQVTEGIVHWRPEAQCWHQTCGGVRHEGQASAVSRICQAEWVQAQMCAERIRARVGAKMWRIGLQRGEGRSIAERHGSR